MTAVFLTPEAEEDLDDAAVWHEYEVAGLGRELVSEVRAVLLRIEQNPESFYELRPGIRRAQVKRFSYGVFYRLTSERIEVIGILHDRRSPRAWQRRASGR